MKGWKITQVLSAAALMAASSGFAADKPGARWVQEPATIFGLALGEAVSEDQLRECSPEPNQPPSAITFCRMDRRLTNTTSVCCFSGIFEFRDGVLFLEDGVANKLLITGRHTDYAAIRALLTERYGRPTSKAVNEVTTKAGAKLSSEELTWTGKALEVVLQERAGRVDQTAIHFLHLPSAAKAAGKRKERAKEDAAKM